MRLGQVVRLLERMRLAEVAPQEVGKRPAGRSPSDCDPAGGSAYPGP